MKLHSWYSSCRSSTAMRASHQTWPKYGTIPVSCSTHHRTLRRPRTGVAQRVQQRRRRRRRRHGPVKGAAAWALREGREAGVQRPAVDGRRKALIRPSPTLELD
eukprot:scaffold28325_cov36-Phaeocystis_antarctica.AAC.1